MNDPASRRLVQRFPQRVAELLRSHRIGSRNNELYLFIPIPGKHQLDTKAHFANRTMIPGSMSTDLPVVAILVDPDGMIEPCLSPSQVILGAVRLE